MSFSIEDLVVSEPTKYISRKKRMAMEQGEPADEIAEEVNKMEEVAVVRHRPQIEFKMISKTGEQVKDEGLKFLQWSLAGSTDYVSYVRGKSNVVQVYDTVTENALFTKKYEVGSPIKGMGSVGQTVFDLKNVIVMENGKISIDQSQNEAPKKKKGADAT